MRKHKPRLAELTVQAKDTYDPAEYVMVHHKYLDGLREALKSAHRHRNQGADCICIYCKPHNSGGGQ